MSSSGSIRRSTRFDPRFKFTTWIYRIASNCAIDRLRAISRRPFSLDAPQPRRTYNVRRIQIASTDQDPSERLGVEGDDEAARDGDPRGFPRAYRRLIVLRHVNSLRYDADRGRRRASSRHREEPDLPRPRDPAARDRPPRAAPRRRAPRGDGGRVNCLEMQAVLPASPSAKALPGSPSTRRSISRRAFRAPSSSCACGS